MRYVISALSFCVAVAAALAAWQWNDPLKAPLVFPLSETFYARSAAATTPKDRIDWALKATKTAPARAENWMLLTHAYHTADAELSPRTLEALKHSYAVAPLSPDVHDWRLSYAFSNWSALPADVRSDALREARVYATRPSGMRFLRALPATVADADGRFAIASVILARQTEQRSRSLESRRIAN